MSAPPVVLPSPTGWFPAGRARYWAATIGKFGVVQLFVQGLGAISGILLVRHLSKGDYALFTITSSMQGTMNVLADSGVSVALASIGGRVWQDPWRLGQLIRLAMRMRWVLAAFVAVAVTPIVIWMLVHNQAPPLYAALLVGLLLAGFLFQLEMDVFVTVPRLHSEIGRLQSLDLGAAAVRLALIAATLAIFLNAAVAVGIAVTSIALQRWLAAGWAREHLAPDADIQTDDRREIGEKIRHLLPNALFYCLQGQVLIFLVSITGHSTQVAEVGALGRLTILLNVLSPIMAAIVLPAFSRCNSRSLLWKRYLLVISVFLLLGIVLLLLASTFADPLLWLLGNGYAHLKSVLLLMTLNTVVTMIVNVMWSMNAAKGWVKNGWINIPLQIALQLVLLHYVDVSDLPGILWFTILSQSAPLIVNCLLTFSGLRRYPVVPTNT